MESIMLAMPFDLVKAGSDDEMRIGGYASTSDRDRQNETVMHKCLDISEFVSSGFFNLDHDGSKILGYPDPARCKIDNYGLYVEGTLLKGVPEAESVWRTAVALKKSNAPRRLGFSIEGKVLSRNANGLITKAKVYNVAITAQPVNTNCTWDALCKSFAAGSQIDTDGDTGQTADAGLNTQNGQALIPESLETAFRNLADIIGQDDDVLAHLSAIREMLCKKSRISKGETALYFALTRGMPLQESMSIVKTIFEEGI